MKENKWMTTSPNWTEHDFTDDDDDDVSLNVSYE